MAFKMRSGNGPLKFKTMGSSPMKQSVVTCPECGMQIEDTDGSGAAMTAHMNSAHGSTGTTGAGIVRNTGGLANQNTYGNNPGGWAGGAGSWDPNANTTGTGYGNTASPRKGLFGGFFNRMFS